jgi:hypothetical protein
VSDDWENEMCRQWLERLEISTAPYVMECPECEATMARSAPFCTECLTMNEHPSARKILTLDEVIILGTRYSQ